MFMKKSLIISFFGSVFVNFNLVALSVLSKGGYIGGHTNSVFGAVLEGNMWTFGLMIIIPAIILFLVCNIYEKQHIKFGKKSYMVHYAFIMFMVTILLVVTAEVLHRKTEKTEKEEAQKMQQLLELQEKEDKSVERTLK